LPRPPRRDSPGDGGRRCPGRRHEEGGAVETAPANSPRRYTRRCGSIPMSTARRPSPKDSGTVGSTLLPHPMSGFGGRRGRTRMVRKNALYVGLLSAALLAIAVVYFVRRTSPGPHNQDRIVINEAARNLLYLPLYHGV